VGNGELRDYGRSRRYTKHCNVYKKRREIHWSHTGCDIVADASSLDPTLRSLTQHHNVLPDVFFDQALKQAECLVRVPSSLQRHNDQRLQRGTLAQLSQNFDGL
jgi:hypothetical protein